MSYKKDFPILNRYHYLDNAATTQKPKVVIDRMKEFLEKEYANTHRGVYRLSENATEEVDKARETVAKFINASKNEVIFTRNATEAFNGLSRSLEEELEGKEIVVTKLEHHSNYLPWVELARKSKSDLVEVPASKIDKIHEYVGKKTGLIAVTNMSNVTGNKIDVKKLIGKSKDRNENVKIVVDATQTAPHYKLDVKEIGVDFLCFSGHKAYGPNVGVLYGRSELLKSMKPFSYGGNMVRTAGLKNTWAEIPDKFEAGTLNVEGIIGLKAAIEYLQENFEEKIKKEKELDEYMLKKLEELEYVNLLGISEGPIASFELKGIHPHDVASIADKYNVCIRAGHHCAQPYMKELGVNATIRASLSFYNEKEDIDRLIEALKEAKRVLNG